MKKQVLLTLLLSSMLALASCGNSTSSSEDISGTGEESTTSEETTSNETSTHDSSDKSSEETTSENSSEEIPTTSSEEIINVTGVTLSGEDKVEVGETISLNAEVLPANATNKAVTYSVESGSEFASISSSGVVSGLAKGTATVKVTTVDGGYSDTKTIEVTKHYNVTYPDIEGMTFTGGTSFEEGELVKFSVTTNLVIDEIRANDIVCGTLDGEYYFYMPQDDVTFVVITVSGEVTHLINNTNPNVVKLSESKARVGEEVNLTFSLSEGYQYVGYHVYGNINAFDLEDRTIIDSTFNDGVITFTMPDEDVQIEIEVTRKTYVLNFIGDNTNQIYYIYNNDNNDSIIRSVGDSYYIPFGTTVKVTFISKTSDNARKAYATGIKVNGLTYLDEADEGYITFKMPSRNVSAEVIVEKVYRPITIINSDHVTLSLYSLVDGEYALLSENKAVYEDKIYIKAVSENDEYYGVNSITGSYYGYSSSGSKNSFTSSVTITSKNADGYYSFTMPYAYVPDGVTITVTEFNNVIFLDKDFVGSYAGRNVYGSNTYDSTNLTASIAVNGSVAYRGSNYTASTYDEDTGIITMSNGYRIFVGDNAMLGDYSLSSTIADNDMNFFYKLEDGKTSSDYSFHSRSYSYTYHFVEVYDSEGELYASAFIRKVGDEFIYDTGVSFDTGDDSTYVNTATSFSIYDKDGNYMTTYNNGTLVTLDGLQGTYVDDNDVALVLDGIGNASYLGNNWTYTVENNVLSLTRFDYSGDSNKYYTVIITLDITNMTFTVNSSSIEDLPAFVNHLYGTTVTSNSYNYISLSFLDGGFNAKIFNPSSATDKTAQWNGSNWTCTFTYDSSTKILVLTTDNNDYPEVRFSYDDENDQFTLLTTIKTNHGTSNADESIFIRRD